MNFCYNYGTYLDGIIEIAYGKYLAELGCHTFLDGTDKQTFRRLIERESGNMQCITAVRNGGCAGYLFYSLKDCGDRIYCNIPVWGCGADSVKTVSYLFTELARLTVTGKPVYFSVHLYASDTEVQRLFSYMQFGIICEKTVRQISEIRHNSNVSVRLLGADELTQRWDEIRMLLSQLIDRLRQSPVFYPCGEFTQEAYKAFFTDSGTRVYVAEDNGRLIGLIESNTEGFEYYFGNKAARNVGEAFVLPEYRGTGAAQALLSYLENDLRNGNILYDWVEHGTANPDGREFWNKYFETVEYEFVRLAEKPQDSGAGFLR